MALTAGDLMEKDVVTVSPDTPLLDVHRLFVEEEIHGAPVVDDEGQVVGVITTLDLLRAVEEEHDTARVDPVYFRDTLPYSSPDWTSNPEDFQDRLSQDRVSDAMSTEVITVSAQASVAEVARLLHDQRVHRVLVVEDGRLAGIISSFDLVGLLAEQGEKR